MHQYTSNVQNTTSQNNSEINSSHSSICRAPHDRENPYAQISRTLIRDKTLSHDVRWFIIYCLSFDGKWEISIPYFLKDQNMSKDKMYRILREAMKAGYIKREKLFVNNLIRYRYTVSETPQFKECFRYPENQDPGNQDTTNKQCNPTTLNSNTNKKKEQKKAPAPSPTSAIASALSDLFLKKLKEKLPNFKDPNMLQWAKEMDLILRIDKRDPDEVKRVIEWVREAKWYKSNCLSPNSLRKYYDKISAQMGEESELIRIRKNRDYAVALKEKYPKEMKALTFDATHVLNREKGKDLPFNLPYETFKEALLNLFGGEYVRRS